jgi:adenine phosphoribosyltransferase
MPLLAEPRAFQEAVDRLCERFAGRTVDAVAAAEARGFLFAAPMALKMKKPLIPLRKPGKLPYRTYSLKYELEYGSAELQVHTDVVTAGAQVLLVDDLLATGGTMEAGCKLIEKAGGQVAACAFLVELAFLKGRDRLKPHEVYSLIEY